MSCLFSIIIPVYNAEKYISKCIESILSQDFFDYEIILVNDGSTDNSINIINDYEKKYNNIKVSTISNSGVVYARKLGLQLANGKYIIYVDSDDYIENYYFSTAHEIICKYKPDIILFDHYKVNKKNRTICTYPYKSKLYSKIEFQTFFHSFLYCSSKGKELSPALWDKIILKDSLLKFYPLVDNSIIMGDDRAITRPVLYNCNSFYYCNKSFYNYVYNPSSLTKSKKVYNMYVPKLIASSFISTIEQDDLDMYRQCYRSTTCSLFNSIISQFNRSDNYKTLVREINRVLNDYFYKDCIKNTHCSIFSFKIWIRKYILKYKLIFIMRLIYLIR